MTAFNLQPAGFKSEGTFVPDDLIAGDFPLVTGSVTIKSGQVLTRGAVLEEGTSGDAGKFSLVTTNANARYILVEDVDATAGDVTLAPVYITGEFNINSITVGSGATKAGVKAALEPRSIYIKTSVAR